MKQSKRPRLLVEALEVRYCPSVTAVVSHGNLLVTADAPTSKLTVTQTANNTFQVTEGSTSFSSTLSGVTKDIVLNLSNGNDTGVAINLGDSSFAALRNIEANLGGGTNDLTVSNGTLTGNVDVHSGAGTDAITLGSASTALAVGRDVDLDMGSASATTLHVLTGVDVKGSVYANRVTVATLDKGSTVE